MICIDDYSVIESKCNHINFRLVYTNPYLGFSRSCFFFRIMFYIPYFLKLSDSGCFFLSLKYLYRDRDFLQYIYINVWSIIGSGRPCCFKVKFNVDIFSAIYGGFFLYYSTTCMWINFVWGKKICTAIKLFEQNVELINVLTKHKKIRKVNNYRKSRPNSTG